MSYSCVILSSGLSSFETVAHLLVGCSSVRNILTTLDSFFFFPKFDIGTFMDSYIEFFLWSRSVVVGNRDLLA